MSHCNTGVPIEVKNFLSQKIFQVFFKTGFFMVQDYGISLSEKIFLNFKCIVTSQSLDIAM